MLCIGVDPSSSCCGVALMNGDTIIWTTVWKPTKGKSGAWNLHNYVGWLKKLLRPNPLLPAVAPMACVEFLGMDRNLNTVRVVSHYQAASVIACKQVGMMVIEARTSSARKEALGRGNMSKEEAWAEIKKMYPEHKFLAKTSGGLDEMDAVVLGKAGPGLAEG